MSESASQPETTLLKLARQIGSEEQQIRSRGGQAAIARQHEKGRWTAPERIEQPVDPDAAVHEVGLWAGHGMYDTWGGVPAAGVITSVGVICGQRHMIIANDAR